MSGRWYRRVRCAAGAAVTALWLVTAVAACAAMTPTMPCNGVAMPCCPPAGSGSAQCSGAQCDDAVPQKAEMRISATAAPQRVAIAIQDLLERPSPSPARELTSGLRFQKAVFRLKDDLRI